MSIRVEGIIDKYAVGGKLGEGISEVFETLEISS